MLGVGVRISCILITDEIFKFFCDIIFNVFDKSEINISLQVWKQLFMIFHIF